MNFDYLKEVMSVYETCVANPRAMKIPFHREFHLDEDRKVYCVLCARAFRDGRFDHG